MSFFNAMSADDALWRLALRRSGRRVVDCLLLGFLVGEGREEAGNGVYLEIDEQIENRYHFDLEYAVFFGSKERVRTDVFKGSRSVLVGIREAIIMVVICTRGVRYKQRSWNGTVFICTGVF